MDTYCIVRNYFRDEHNNNGRGRVIRRGLSLAEAQAHCGDPQTSSSTCTSAAGKRRTRKLGHWFDSFTPEPR